MIISRTPLRISFFGGGTDYPAWFNTHGGAVLATSINKYCYVLFHNGKVWHTFELPTKAGLGSSSAYTVGLLRVCTKLNQKTIAELATVWETDKLGGNIGVQDQYICAVGGFHLLRFDEQGIRDRIIEPELVKPLENYLMLFDTHIYRRAGEIVAQQIKEMDSHAELLHKMRAMVDDGMELLRARNYPSFGKLLHETWEIKKQLSPHISTPEIDAIYQAGLSAGALGGKILGAGGGGFILFFAEPDKQEAIKNALEDCTYVPVQFENEGSQIIFNNGESNAEILQG